MRRGAWFAVPFVGVLMVAGAAAWALRDDAPPAEIPEVTFDELNLRQPWVRLRGTAHYPSTITQRVPATLLSPEQTFYLFAFFPENDTGGRMIPVLVRTRREPERMVAFETMTVEGRLAPLTKDKVVPTTETVLSQRTDYFFADGVMLLEPVRIHHEDGVWEEPP